MQTAPTEILRQTETLILKTQELLAAASHEDEAKEAEYALKCLAQLGDYVLQDKLIFGIEPWHALVEEPPLSVPGEMLLRLKDCAGKPLPPYPAIMTFYQNGMTEALDTVLFLAALNEFRKIDEKQVSINISALSLRDAHFIKTVLGFIEEMELEQDEKIIIEIHESAPNSMMSQKVLQLFRKFDVAFAIDDVGLSMNDVFRLSEFEDIADFVKIDRHAVEAHKDDPGSVGNVLSFIKAMFPEAAVVAEGVKTVEHAYELSQKHPDIIYAQGLYLPDREEFREQWEKAVVESREAMASLPAKERKEGKQPLT